MNQSVLLTVVVAGTTYTNFTEQALFEAGVEQSVINETKVAKQQADINETANKYIVSIYPEWKQLNILRAGTTDEKEAMSNFIDSVRDWSNSANPQLDELHEILA